MNYLITILIASLAAIVYLSLIHRETKRRDAIAHQLAKERHERAERFLREMYTRKR